MSDEEELLGNPLPYDLLQETEYTCPYCWQSNTTLLDLSAPPDALIEDCRICCRPILLEISLAADSVASVEASPSD